MNIYDISKLSGFSITTVSRVLNGSDKVSDKTRNKILETIESAGYTPNAFARGLGLDTMKTVGLLCVDPSDPNACMNFIQSIGFLERELRRYGYDSVLYCVGFDMKEKADCLRMMLQRRVDAIIILGSFFIEPSPKSNQCILDAAASVPVWLLNGNFAGENVHSVLCDDFNISKEATSYLLDKGARDILFLYTTMTESERRRLSGFLKAHKEIGLDVPKSHILKFPLGIDGDGRTARLLDGLRFDAVLACEDAIAINVLKYAKAKGIAIPEDLMIIGHGNSLLARSASPELSSVDNNIDFVCSSIVSMLIHHFSGTKAPERMTISGKLVHRGTTRR